MTAVLLNGAKKYKNNIDQNLIYFSFLKIELNLLLII